MIGLALQTIDRINDGASQAAIRGRTPMTAWVGAEAYAAIKVYVASLTRLDLHEVCGDYDRPSSPWFGSRPQFQSIRLVTPGGEVSLQVRLSLDTAVIVEDTTGEPWPVAE